MPVEQPKPDIQVALFAKAPAISVEVGGEVQLWRFRIDRKRCGVRIDWKLGLLRHDDRWRSSSC